MRGSLYALEQLLDSKIVIDSGHGNITMGSLTYIEGDIFELHAGKHEGFRIGQQVRVVVYTREGMLNFHTTVIGKYQHVMILLNPPEIMNMTLRQRKHTRIKTDLTGHIHTLIDARHGEAKRCTDPVEFLVYDVALGGVGIMVPGQSDIPVGSRLLAEIRHERSLVCQLEVIHRTPGADFLRYGARFLNFTPQEEMELRSFILTQQVRARLQEVKQAAVTE